MSGKKISCLYRRNTFFGTYDVAPADQGNIVQVSYNGRVLRARIDGFPVRDVAETLMTQLVAREAISQDRPEWRPRSRPAITEQNSRQTVKETL